MRKVQSDRRAKVAGAEEAEQRRRDLANSAEAGAGAEAGERQSSWVSRAGAGFCRARTVAEGEAGERRRSIRCRIDLFSMAGEAGPCVLSLVQVAGRASVSAGRQVAWPAAVVR